MSNKISISVADLNDQASAMEALAADYNDVLLKLTSVGIHLATSINEKRVKKILDELDNIYKITTKSYDSLMSGAKIARAAAETYTNVDTELRKAVDNGELDLDKSAYENIAASNQIVSRKGDISTDFGKSYENATNRGITYYSQKKNNQYYNADNWKSGGKNYEGKAGVGCGVSCDAMMLSSLGVTKADGTEYTPGDLVAKNGGSAAHDGNGVNKVLEQNGLGPETYGSSGHTAQQMQTKLDQYLENYAKDPDKYSPPMVCIDMEKEDGLHNHYVLVVGKDKDGGYICVDPNLDGRSTFKIGTKVSTNNTTYTSYIKFIKTFSRS